MTSANMAPTTMTGDVITLENYESKMPMLDPSNPPSSPLFALVDMGSNGIRFSITSISLSPPTARLLPCIYRERRGISLYDALHDSSDAANEAFVFPQKVITMVASTMAYFRRICESYAVPEHQISVFATEAMRTAHNRDEMLEAIRQASGFRVEMLSTAMESLFGAMGARSAYGLVQGIFMDLGGGSVQMTYIDSSVAGYDVLAAKAAQSIPFGAARLTQALSEPRLAWTTQADLQRAMQSMFEGLMAQFPALRVQAESSDGINLYMCGGGFRGYGSMLAYDTWAGRYPFPETAGSTVSCRQFMNTDGMLKANKQAHDVFEMSKRRREQFPAIVTVVEALIRVVPRIKQVDFCSGGNREGVLFMKLPPAIRETDPLFWCNREYLPNAGASIEDMVSTFSKCLPDGAPSVLTTEIQRYVIQNTWVGMGKTKEVNAARCLHAPISALDEGFAGLRHETRAILSLIMVARWAIKLGQSDLELHESLRGLVGGGLSFWCEYVGTVSRLFGTVFPNQPANGQLLRDTISMSASMVTVDQRHKHSDARSWQLNEVDQPDKHSFVKLLLRLNGVDPLALTADDIGDMFKRVRNGHHHDKYEVEIEFTK